MIRDSPELLKKLMNFFIDFINLLTYQRVINVINCLIIASRSSNLIGDCLELLKKLMSFFQFFQYFVLLACY